ncbi:MAG: hypothetical protein HY963_07955 [Ignavibacteriales bacterium]|nr:hypothetical protein [Ignavibacteriales bacterium]
MKTKVVSVEKSSFKSVGVGEEKRFETKELIGLELMYNNFLIHQSAIKIS